MRPAREARSRSREAWVRKEKTIGPRRTLTAAAAAALLGLALRTQAHDDAAHARRGAARKEQQAWGIAGEPKAARRTVAVRMLDTMRFEPDRIDVRLDETVRFEVRNTGSVMHEFVIGTKAANERHAALMMRFPDMQHSEPYMTHVPPGEHGEIVWTFNRAGMFEFACLIAGHYQAGMAGTITVRTS